MARPIRSGKCSLTRDGISTLAVAIPARATAEKPRKTGAVVGGGPAAETDHHRHQREGQRPVQADDAREGRSERAEDRERQHRQRGEQAGLGAGQAEPAAYLLEHRVRR